MLYNRLFLIVFFIILLNIYLIKNLSNEIPLINIEKCPEISKPSKEYIHVDFTKSFPLNYSLICKNNDHLLVYIFSTSKNIQRRESIRRTWANKRIYKELNSICFIFLIGLSLNQTINNEIKNEALLNNDLIQINIEDTYANVIYKEIGALKWSYLYSSYIPYLFKTDDDLIVDTFLLNDIIQYFISNQTKQSLYFQKDKLIKDFLNETLSYNKMTLFRGTDMSGILTFRNGKYKIHQLAWNSQRLPHYCSGFGFVYSSYIRNRLYRASLCYENQYVPLVGDVFMSGLLAGAASVRCSKWSLMTIQSQRSCSLLFREESRLLVCSTPLHRGKEIYSDFDSTWQIILQRHSKHFNSSSFLTNNSSNLVIIY
ncbi:hypothetical protein I4U23_010736 [Adineta vaga]|nr:hypothetical protein I4U23_010736 [Adineta vaga]